MVRLAHPEPALTFDDVLLLPGASHVTPNQVDLKTQVEAAISFAETFRWICKKQGSTTLSTTKAEYMLATSCCIHHLIKNQLEDYNICESKILIYYDNKAAISLLKIKHCIQGKTYRN